MKRFITSVLCVSVFFVGLGGLVDRVGATLRSDEKALNLIRLARQAIGGDAALGGVKSLSATGRATKTFESDGTLRSEQGEWEFALELPNRFSKTLKVGAGGEKIVATTAFVENRIEMKKSGEGETDNLVRKIETADGKTKAFVVMKKEGSEKTEVGAGENSEKTEFFVKKDEKGAARFEQNELVRMTLALLLTAPEGVDVSYRYAGEATVDGYSCEVVEAQTGGGGFKLYLDKASYLPRMLVYQGLQPAVFRMHRNDSGEPTKEKVKVFADQVSEPPTAEIHLRFSDYRSVNGIQLPFRWTQTIGGKEDEVIDITSYEINPANINEKFQKAPRRVVLKTPK